MYIAIRMLSRVLRLVSCACDPMMRVLVFFKGQESMLRKEFLILSSAGQESIIWLRVSLAGTKLGWVKQKEQRWSTFSRKCEVLSLVFKELFRYLSRLTLISCFKQEVCMV